jgi:hypothetical protein
MKAVRTVPTFVVLAVTLAAVAACDGKGLTKKQLELISVERADTIFALRNQVLEQVMEGTKFVNDINVELSKARSLAIPQKELLPTAELADANEERRRIVARVTQLVTRLDNVSFRLSTTRNQLIERDSALARKVAEHELLMAQASQAAERVRQELQATIDGQAREIASLTGHVNALTGKLGQLTTEKNAVYVVVGTRKELIKKGILVAEGPRRFGVVGPKTVTPNRQLDPSMFTKLDRTSDVSILLPHGGYKIVSRQNTAFAAQPVNTNGTYAGAIMIEDPEQFWSTSKFLIVVRS